LDGVAELGQRVHGHVAEAGAVDLPLERKPVWRLDYDFTLVREDSA